MNIKILNYQIHIDFSLILFVTLLFFINKSFFIFSSILASLIHESGHLIALKNNSSSSNQLEFSLFKFNIIDKNRISKSLHDDLIILLSGPIFNLVTFILFFAISKFYNNEKLYFFAFENLFLFVFNLLPIIPLDGGQILFILLSSKIDFLLAQKIISIISLILIYITSLIGFFIFLSSKYNISILLFSLYMMFFFYKKTDFYF